MSHPGKKAFMNRHLLTLLLFVLSPAAAPLAAQQIYLRVPGSGFCRVLGATNATPIRMTVSGSCGLSEGATVMVADVRGNLAANIHLNDAADTANLARKVVNLSGASFDLYDLQNQPVPGSGAFTGGGRVGLVAQYALRGHPVMFFDGPAGPRTTAMYDPGNKANTANPSYQVLLNVSNQYIAQYGQRWGWELENYSFLGAATLTSAIRWKLDGNTAARDAALFGLRNADQLVGTTACNESVQDCGAPISSIADYPLQYALTYYQAYSLMRDDMTPTERATFAEYFLSDLPWTQAGINYTAAASLIKPSFIVSDKETSGTISIAANSTTLVGTGTAFTTQVSVGDVLYLPHASENIYAKPYLVESIQSDTELTINRFPESPLTDKHWMAGPRWNNTQYGFLWHQKHQAYTPLSGGAPNVPSPYYGLNTGLFQFGDNNLSMARALGMYGMGLATCQDDPRGCLLASLAYEWFFDECMPFNLMLWTGFSPAGTVYHQARVLGLVLEWALWTKNSFQSAPDPLAGTNIREMAALYVPYAAVPQNAWLTVSEDTLIYPAIDRMTAALVAMADDKTAAYSRHFKWWLQNIFNYTVGAVSYSNGSWGWEHYVLYEPTTSALAVTNSTHHFKDANESVCLAVYGAANCPMPDARRVSISRSDWNTSATYLAVNASGYACRDHCADELGGYYHVFKNGKALIAQDSNAYMGSRSHRNYVDVGGPANTRLYPDEVGIPVPWTGGNSDYMFVRVNTAPGYKAAANVTAMERQWMHLKKGAQDYIIDHVKGTFSSPQPVKGLQHFHLNNCGTPSATSCVTLIKAENTAINTQPGARLSSRAFGVGGNVIVDTQTGVETNGSYIGGTGKSFRWHVCPSANGTDCDSVTDAEWIVVSQASSDTGATLPAITQTMSGAFRVIEIADPVSPKVAALTAFGQTGTTVTLATTHAGTAQYGIAGLAPGPYVVLRNGIQIGTPIQVEAGNHTLSFESESGTIVIEPGPPPLTITTTHLANAVVNRPYHATVEAISATSPYTWDISAGALCAGLSLTPGPTSAEIVGTATALGTCTFTVRATSFMGAEVDTQVLTITVQPPGPDPLTLLTTALPVARTAELYTAQLSASGGTVPYVWSIASGTLCPGLTIGASTGQISGTPLTGEPCTFTARVTDLGNDFRERTFTLSVIDNLQVPLHISAAEASFSAAVVRFGRRGLPHNEPCTLELRLGGPGGNLLASLSSPTGPSRRQLVATGLPPSELIHATVTCGADTDTATFTTSATPAPQSVRPVLFRLVPPTILGAPADAVISYGPTAALGNSVVVPCNSVECTTTVDTPDPLLYWSVRYRDSGGATLAESDLRVKAPR